MDHISRQAWSRAEFETQLRALGAFYHVHHPFHIAMNKGQCSPAQIRGWVANRYYYQINIPLKDAAVIANCPDQAVRRHWVQRIIDHDGREAQTGGIEAWLRLGEACGLDRDEMITQRAVLPGVRFAVDAYVNFARRASWQEAACSSLTEMFAPAIHQQRLDGWPQHYPWIDSEGYAYFRSRLSEARRDVAHGLQITLDHFITWEQQQKALSILQLKLDILWAMLDAMQIAYHYNEPPYHCVKGGAVRLRAYSSVFGP
jgi:pyrroloquinoline-quinone synthase